MRPSRALLVWWSTNTRAASVLLAAARSLGVPRAVVVDPAAAPPPDAPDYPGEWSIVRAQTPLTARELSGIGVQAADALGVSEISLAPTSEYLLTIAIGDRCCGRIPNLRVPWAAAFPYARITSKASLRSLLAEHPLLQTPGLCDFPTAARQLPVMAKPSVNVLAGRPLRPFKVSKVGDLSVALGGDGGFFFEEWIPPPSVYWCAFRGSDGNVVDYFQRNVLQEVGGGSVSLAVREDPAWAPQVRPDLLALVEGLSYRGPLMIEFRGDPPVVIEINPRFWGPLLLDVTSSGGVVASFFREEFGVETSLGSRFPTSSIYAVPTLLDAAEGLDSVGAIGGQDTVRAPGAHWATLLMGFSPAVLGGAW